MLMMMSNILIGGFEGRSVSCVSCLAQRLGTSEVHWILVQLFRSKDQDHLLTLTQDYLYSPNYTLQVPWEAVAFC